MMEIGNGYVLTGTVKAGYGVTTYVFSDNEPAPYTSEVKVTVSPWFGDSGSVCALDRETTLINSCEVKISYDAENSYASFVSGDRQLLVAASNTDTETWFDILDRLTRCPIEEK